MTPTAATWARRSSTLRTPLRACGWPTWRMSRHDHRPCPGRRRLGCPHCRGLHGCVRAGGPALHAAGLLPLAIAGRAAAGPHPGQGARRMSEHHLQTWTERHRDQARIEALEAELAGAKHHIDKLAGAYTDALDALAEAQWHASGVVLQHALWALAGA